LRNPDFPRTYISRIHLDLASPNHFVNLVWTGPNASRQQSGPFRSSPGAGGATTIATTSWKATAPNRDVRRRAFTRFKPCNTTCEAIPSCALSR
jgi:hypothetical protein